MSNKFQIIVADPPWGGFNDSLTMSDVKRGAISNYPVMSNKDIMNIDIKSIADPNGCVLALWVPSSLLQIGMDVMKAWGFTQKQTWIWIKTQKDPLIKIRNQISSGFPLRNLDDFLSFGLGRLGRNAHELVLIGICGKVYKNVKNKSQRTVFFAPNTKHSQKPELLQDKLELIFPDQSINKIEIFARRQRPNWVCLGDEIDGLDIRDAISKLI
jgi:N6-adenosine-specific RNA methylase IME4